MSDSNRIFPDITECIRAVGRVQIRPIFKPGSFVFDLSSTPPIPPSPISAETDVPDNKPLIVILSVAEGWAVRARSSLVHLHTWDRAMLVAGRRPEERALLASALDVVDWVRAQTGGIELLDELGIARPNPASSAKDAEGALRQRLAWVHKHEFSPPMGEG